MKDLTYYFHSPPQEKSNENSKTLECVSIENSVVKEIKKSKKRKRKKKNNHSNMEELASYGETCEIKYISVICQESVVDSKNNSFEAKDNNFSSNAINTSDLVSSREMTLDENIEIDNIPVRMRHSSCKVDDELDQELTLLGSNKKRNRKRKNSLSEDKPKKKSRRSREKIKQKTLRVSFENSVDVDSSVLVNSESEILKNLDESVDDKDSELKEFVGIKLKKVKKCAGESSVYEINTSKGSKRKSKVNSKFEVVSKDKSIDDCKVFKNDENGDIRNSDLKKGKVKNKKKKCNPVKENINLENLTEKCFKVKNKMLKDANELTNQFEPEVSEDDFKENSGEIKCELEKPENDKRNSLFNYYSKIDKATFQETKRNEKIKVEAIIHTPPNHKSKSSPSSSGSEEATKVSKWKQSKKLMSKELDEITVLSSEIIEVIDEDENSENCNFVDKLDSNTPVKPGSSWKMRVCLSAQDTAVSVDSDDSDNGDSMFKNEPISKKNVGNNKSIKDSVKIIANKMDSIKEINKLISSKVTSAPRTTQNFLNSSNKKSPSGSDIMAKFLGIQLKEPPKSVLDPAIIEARQKFLESGVPDIIKQKIDNSQSEKVLASPAPLPKFSHVQQRNPLHIVWNLPAVSMKLYPSPTINLSSFDLKWISFSEPKSVSASDVFSNDLSLVPIADPKKCVKNLKKVETVLNVKECWEAVKEMKSSDSSDFDVWSEVYKPRKSSDIISNYDNIQKLKSWMESLKKNRLDIQDDESSSGEFVDSDSEDKASSLGSLCIICGPYGCGKTSAVFAIANELGYKVFEVNCSSNRNGKKVLTDLSEATQSHQVEHSHPLSNFFKQGSIKDKGRKKKKKKPKAGKLESSAKSVNKKSLILIEDADLLFNDKDEGFISAIATLAGSSKRPLVLVVNDIRAPHLSKLFEMNPLILNFHQPSAAKIELWLQLIALANEMKLKSDAAQKLVKWSECDLRKSLLQLQLLVESHRENENSWPGITDSPVWFSAVSNTEKIQSHEETVTKSKALYKKQLKSTAILAQSLVINDLLTISATSSGRLRNPCPLPSKISPAASTSLLDCSEPICGNNLSSDIADYLYGSVSTCVTSQLRNQNLARKTEQALLTALPPYMQCSRDAAFVDYLPTLRLFGRSETIRLALHTKRTNRFFNYLNRLGVNASDSCIKYMCDTFS